MSERVAIDKGGRIVIPRPLRTRLGLREGDLLVIDEQNGELVVRQEKLQFGLVERGGLLFKPRDRKAGVIDPEEINRLIETLRDPGARAALEQEQVRRPKKATRKRKGS